MYVFDTNSLSNLLGFYPKRFPSLWRECNKRIDNGIIISVKEVAKELAERNEAYSQFVKDYKKLFHEPSAEEAKFLAEIFKVKNFQHSLEQRKLLKGGTFADPFVIAKAKISIATVVTQEKLKPNAAKVPNICSYFQVPCIDLEGFMEQENLQF